MRYFQPTIILLLFLGSTLSLSAQQLPQMSSHIFQPVWYNPAALGEGQVAVVHRRQWTEFDASIAPNTYALNLDLSPILPNADWMGIGLNVLADQVHVFKRNEIDLRVAFHLIPEGEHRLSLGAGVGLMQQSIDFTKLKGDYSGDPAILGGEKVNDLLFRAGPGLHYRYSGNGGSSLTASVAVPQLFSSDLKLGTMDDIGGFDNRFHLEAGLQYRMELDNFGIEPALLFRGANSEASALGKSTLDLSARAFFLDDRFWVAGGYRFNGESLLGGLGVKITDQLQFQAYYEQHSALGGTAEIAVVYQIAERPKPPAELPIGISADIELRKKQLEQVHQKINSQQQENFEEQMTAANRALSQSQYQGLSSEEVVSKLAEARTYILEGMNTLEGILSSGEAGLYAFWEAQRISDAYVNDGGDSRQMNRALSPLQKKQAALNAQLEENLRTYLTVHYKNLGMEQQKGVTPSFSSLFANKDVPGLQEKLSEGLGYIPGIAYNAKVDVEEQAGVTKITYAFPYGENTYTIGDGINARQVIIDHIWHQVSALQSINTNIERISLRMLLQDGLVDLRTVTTNYPYLGEFGETININYSELDTSEGSAITAKVLAKKGASTSIVELAALKLYDLRAYLQSKALNGAIELPLEISGPNYEEEENQLMKIEITFRR